MDLGFGIILILIFTFLFGQPLFVIMAAITGLSYYLSDESLTVVIGDIFFAADKEILLAIPLFVLAGQIMTKGSISTRLIAFAKALTAGIPSGMAIASILSCAVFAAISGSSPVTLIAIGSLMYPALIKEGYPRSFAVGSLSVGGTLGIIVPPSIPMIIFAIMASVSVVDLFKAGIGPSLVLISLLIAYSLIKAPATKTQVYSFAELKVAFKRGIFSVLMPVFILGGIYSGFFTATESAAIAVLYAVVIEFFVHRDIKMKEFIHVFRESAEMLGLLFLILIIAVSLNKYLTFEGIPQLLVDKMTLLISSKWGFLIIINIFLLIVGCVMDVMSAILVLAPLLTPMAIHYGIDPVHFGIIMIVNLEIGYITPPIGINLFVASGIFQTSIGEVIKSVIPFVFIMLIGLILISVFPQISLFTLSR